MFLKNRDMVQESVGPNDVYEHVCSVICRDGFVIVICSPLCNGIYEVVILTITRKQPFLRSMVHYSLTAGGFTAVR
jgi:hypothetical protein